MKAVDARYKRAPAAVQDAAKRRMMGKAWTEGDWDEMCRVFERHFGLDNDQDKAFVLRLRADKEREQRLAAARALRWRRVRLVMRCTAMGVWMGLVGVWMCLVALLAFIIHSGSAHQRLAFAVVVALLLCILIVLWASALGEAVYEMIWSRRKRRLRGLRGIQS